MRFATIAALVIPGISSAAITVYTNEGDFNATLGATPTYHGNFGSLTGDSVPASAATPVASIIGEAGRTSWLEDNSTFYESWLSQGARNSSARGADAAIPTGTLRISINGSDTVVALSIAPDAGAPDSYGTANSGFTMAAIPEAGSAWLGILGTALLLKRRRS